MTSCAEKSTDRLKTLRRETVEQIKMLLNGNHVQPYVLLSGGKDSLAALSIVKAACETTQNQVIAIHADTTVGIPDNLDYVQDVCLYLALPLVIVRPQNDYFTLAKAKGLPRFKARWCCGELKVKPLRDYIRKQQGDKIIFDGIRAEESEIRAAMPQLSWHKHFECQVYHPILHWSNEDVLQYLQEEDVPLNPLYSKGFKRASECWCGVFKGVDEFRLLRDTYPDLFDRLVELEASMRNGSSYLFQRGKRIYLRDLREEAMPCSKCIVRLER